VLYSNSIRPDEIERLRKVGSVAEDPYPLRDGLTYPNDQLKTGARVFRFQCSVCHTYDGANGLLELTGTWTLDQKRMNIAELQRTKPFMPPFAGPASEVEALVQLLSWRRTGMPQSWPVSEDPAALTQIQAWLDLVGTRPGIELMGQRSLAAADRPTGDAAGATAKERP
jgi:cytochrome bd ubiquinol oxidase subunit I